MRGAQDSAAASSSTTAPTAAGPPSSGRAHDPAAHDHAVGQLGHGARLVAGRDAEPHRHRQLAWLRARAPRPPRGRRAARLRSPVVPVSDTAYTKPRASAPISRTRSGVLVGATSGTSARPSASQAARSSAASSCGRSGTISPAAPADAARRANASGPRRQHDVRVDHQHHRQPGGQALAHAEHPVRGGSRGERARGGVVDHRPVGQRIREGDPELDQVGAGRGGRLARRQRGRRGPGTRPSGTASARPACRVRRRPRRSGPPRCRMLGAHRRAGAPRRSLAEHLGQVLVAAPREGHERHARASDCASSQAIAWAGSSAGRMPSSSATRLNAASASSSPTAT